MKTIRNMTLLAWIFVAASSLVAAQSRAETQPSQSSVSISIRAVHDVIKSGAPIVVEVRETNTSAHNVNNSRLDGPIQSYVIDVRDERGQAVPEREELSKLNKPAAGRSAGSIGSIELRTLKPRETRKEFIRISRYYNMDLAGKYTIQLALRAAADVKSNTITVTVVP